MPENLPLMGCLEYKPSKVISWPRIILPKLQGINARYYDGKFYSRDMKVWNDDVVSHCVELLKFSLPDFPTNIMLHGEFYCHGWTQGEHTSNISVKLKKPTEKTREVLFHVFDFWRPQSSFNYAHRLSILGRNNMPNLVAHWKVNNEIELQRSYEDALASGYEGIIIADPLKTYINGKSSAKLKLKKFKDAEFDCIKIEEGTGRNRGRLGALVCLTSNGKHKFNVGSGFSDEERINFYNKPPIDKMISVRYQYLSDDAIPVHPTFLSVRDYE